MTYLVGTCCVLRAAQAREEGKTKPHIILRNLTTKPGQVFSLLQGRRDIDAIYSLGLFEDVSMRPQPAEGSSLENPKVGGGRGGSDAEGLGGSLAASF